MKNFQGRGVRIRIPNPICPERLDPDPVCPEKLDPDPVNIRPDPQPCRQFKYLFWPYLLPEFQTHLVFWPLNHYHRSKAFYQNFVPLYSLNTKTRLYVFKFSGEAQPLPSPFVDLSNDNRSLPKLFLLPPFLTSSFSVTPAAKAASVVLVDLNLFENIWVRFPVLLVSTDKIKRKDNYYY